MGLIAVRASLFGRPMKRRYRVCPDRHGRRSRALDVAGSEPVLGATDGPFLDSDASGDAGHMSQSNSAIHQCSDLRHSRRGPNEGARFSMAIDEINRMSQPVDLVLLTGNVTDTERQTNGTSSANAWAHCASGGRQSRATMTATSPTLLACDRRRPASAGPPRHEFRCLQRRRRNLARQRTHPKRRHPDCHRIPSAAIRDRPLVDGLRRAEGRRPVRGGRSTPFV